VEEPPISGVGQSYKDRWTGPSLDAAFSSWRSSRDMLAPHVSLFRRGPRFASDCLFRTAQGQNQGTTIRVNMDLVSVGARVTDKQSQDVSGLTADGFALFEDGRRQKISFLDTEKEPISLSILVDSSSSMNADDKLAAAQGMLEELISRSRLDDAVSVLQFTDHVVGFKQIAREQRLLTIPTGITSESGGTALYDAVASAMCHLRTSKNLRQVIVVITDGDQHSRFRLEQLIRLVESSYEVPRHRDNQVLFDRGLIGIGVLAAYGPWWDEFVAWVYIDAGWTKMRSPSQTIPLKSQGILNDSSGGIVFRLNDGGYYAFLLSTSSKAYKGDELSFKLVKKTYRGISEEVIVPWTRLSAKQVQQDSTAGIELTAECHGDQITLLVDDQQVGRVRDATYESGYVGFMSLGTGHAVFRNLHADGTR
jgi:Mg-chelatase subunit ChlD